MRIVSFLPTGTSILLALGLKRHIVGISHESVHLPEASDLPVVSGLIYDENALNARETDEFVSASYAQGRNIYRIDEKRLRALAPDLLVAQDLCAVCAVTPNDLQQFFGRLHPAPKVLNLNAHTLSDALEDIRRTAQVTGTAAAGERLVAQLKARIEAVRCRAQQASTRRRVFCLEWPDPLYNSGHWVPEMVAIAGGVDELGAPGGYAVRVSWERIHDYDPDIIVGMMCGFPRERALREMEALRTYPGYEGLAAVRRRAVWVVDGPRYFSQAGPSLIDGLEILGKVLHPELFGPPSEEALRFEG